MSEFIWIIFLVEVMVAVAVFWSFRIMQKRRRQRACAAIPHNESQLRSFLANMSHEVRTPLGVILGFAELLCTETSLAKADLQHIRQVIRRNGELLSNIVNDILDFSKVEAGKLDIERKPVTMAEIVHDIDSTFAAQAAAKNINWSCRAIGPVPTLVHTDPLRLRQVLINVIGNAVKFTQTGGVSVKVEYTPGRTRRLTFMIEDTGPGIDGEAQLQIFEPFGGTSTPLVNRPGGTGLGLVLARRLAGLLGGDVCLTSSTIGVGSVFRVEIDAGEPLNVAGVSRRAQSAYPG